MSTNYSSSKKFSTRYEGPRIRDLSHFYEETQDAAREHLLSGDPTLVATLKNFMAACQKLPKLVNNSPAKTAAQMTQRDQQMLELNLVDLSKTWTKIRNAIRARYTRTVTSAFPHLCEYPESELILHLLYQQDWHRLYKKWDAWKYNRSAWGKKNKREWEARNLDKVRAQDKGRQYRYRWRQAAFRAKEDVLAGKPVQERFLEALGRLREVSPTEADEIAKGLDLKALEAAAAKEEVTPTTPVTHIERVTLDELRGDSMVDEGDQPQTLEEVMGEDEDEDYNNPERALERQLELSQETPLEIDEVESPRESSSASEVLSTDEVDSDEG